MDIFITILLKLIPLYVIILFGYIAGKYFHIKKEAIALLLLYFVAPVIMFNGVLTTYLNPNTLSLPILFFVICAIASASVYFIAGFFWKDSTRNILAFSAGSANTGYFGLPVAVAIFGTYVDGIAALILLGTALYATTVGFFIAAKGHHSAKESFIKLLKFPLLYAFIVGATINSSGFRLPDFFFDTLEYFNGAFTVLGMMLIGIALAGIKRIHIDYKYISISLFAKFVLWPLIIFGIIFLDNQYFKFYDPELHLMLIVMAFVPVAANIVSYATVLEAHPEKASLDVLVSTIAALFLIPLAVVLFL